jgi:hypothetical protein
VEKENQLGFFVMVALGHDPQFTYGFFVMVALSSILSIFLKD